MKQIKGLAVILVVSALALALTPCAFAFSGAYTDSAESQTIGTESLIAKVVDEDGQQISAITTTHIGAQKTGSTYTIEDTQIGDGAFLSIEGKSFKQIYACAESSLPIKCALTVRTGDEETDPVWVNLSETPVVVPCAGAGVGKTIVIHLMIPKCNVPADMESADISVKFIVDNGYTGANLSECATTVMHIDDVVVVEGDGKMSTGKDAEGHVNIQIFADDTMKDAVGVGSKDTHTIVDIADETKFCIQYTNNRSIIASLLGGDEKLVFTISWDGLKKPLSVEINTKDSSWVFDTNQGYIGLVNGKLTLFESVSALDQADAWLGGEGVSNISVDVSGHIATRQDNWGGRVLAGIILADA